MSQANSIKDLEQWMETKEYEIDFYLLDFFQSTTQTLFETPRKRKYATARNTHTSNSLRQTVRKDPLVAVFGELLNENQWIPV